MGKVVVLQECGSTNIEAADKESYSHGDVVRAICQTAGRGQRGHKWDSTPGENLTFSLVWEPSFLHVSQQFLISEAVALAITDTLAEYGIEAQIKWTNDIYIGERKICGILIEHSLCGASLSRSIVGIGLNVNQTEFPQWVSNPDSMAVEAGCKFDVDEVFGRLYINLARRYEMLSAGDYAAIRADYYGRMFRRDVGARFFIPEEGEVFGKIRGVEDNGALIVEIEGLCRSFLFKEIEFII